MNKKMVFVAFFALFSLLCAPVAWAATPDTTTTLKVGVTSGPHEEILEVVKELASKDGLHIEIITFSDYTQPNAALADKELDVNSFQHQPYLDNMVKDRGYQLVSIGKTVVLPMAIYSKRYKALTDVKDGATVAIPNDPSNGGRALLLLQSAGLVKLNPDAGILPSVMDVVENARALKFVELDAASLVRSVEDTDLAVVNSNYAVEAGLIPARDALFVENQDSPYANVIVVHQDNKDNAAIQKFLAIYQSDPVRAFIHDRFQGAVVPVW